MYVVFGVPGQTGSVVANSLLSKGLPIRVVIRNPIHTETWQAKGADVAIADVSDVHAVTEAMQGATAAYLMNPPAYNIDDMFLQAEIVGKSYLEAIKHSQVQKIALLSSVGTHLSQGTGNIRTTYILEQILSELEISVAFIRAAWFMENWQSVASLAAEQGILPSFLSPLDRKIPMVSAIDIGRTCAEVINEDWIGKRIIELYGAAEYSPNDVATAFTNVLKRDVQAIEIPESEWQKTLAGFGFSPGVVNAWCEMLGGFNSGYIVFEDNNTEKRRGQITFEQAAKEMTTPYQ